MGYALKLKELKLSGFHPSFVQMETVNHLAKHFRDVHFGGNWTASNLKDQLADVSWKQATTRIADLNTIATLTFHIHYFVKVVTKVLEGGPLEGNDKLSFNHPPITSEEDWQAFLNEVWTYAERMGDVIETLPEELLWEDFTDAKFGNYYRNIQGIIEHSHYHLGQISLIKKLVQAM